MAEEPGVGGDLIVLTPETYARHEGATRHVEQMVRVNRPLTPGTRRPPVAPGAWGFLSAGSTITGASGHTLGTGTVELCTRSGNTLTGTGEMVDCWNSCDAITAPSGGQIIALLWVDGWSIG
jgi:hypothetical protein